MRRSLPVALIGLGVFLLTIGLVVRFYGYGHLARAEADPRLVIDLEAADATVFNPAKLAQVTTDLSVQQHVAGDLEAAEKAPDDVVVWFTTTSIRDSDKAVIQRSMERTALNARTGEIDVCCESFARVVDSGIAADERKGLLPRFPFGTERRDYQVWDDTVGGQVKARFEGVTRKADLEVYRFVMSVPRKVVGTREISASAVGLGTSGKVTLDHAYELEREVFVEPVTGAIVDDVRTVHEALTQNDTELLTLMSGTLRFTDAQVKESVKKYGDQAARLQLVHSTVPLTTLVLGILSLGLGLVLSRGGGSRRRKA